jgi:hypothetical protein
MQLFLQTDFREETMHIPSQVQYLNMVFPHIQIWREEGNTKTEFATYRLHLYDHSILIFDLLNRDENCSLFVKE